MMPARPADRTGELSLSPLTEAQPAQNLSGSDPGSGAFVVDVPALTSGRFAPAARRKTTPSGQSSRSKRRDAPRSAIAPTQQWWGLHHADAGPTSTPTRDVTKRFALPKTYLPPDLRRACLVK